MFRVELGLSDTDRLVETVDAMRAWFDEHGITPVTFGYSLTAARTLFRIDFTTNAEAIAFAKVFDGVAIDHTPGQRSA